MSEEFAWQAWLQVVEQRRMLELLKRQADTEAVRRAQVMLGALERVYGVALYRLNADRAVSSRSQPRQSRQSDPGD